MCFVGITICTVIEAIKFSVYFTDNIVAVRAVKFFSVSFNICYILTFGNVSRTVRLYFQSKTAYLYAVQSATVGLVGSKDHIHDSKQ